MKKLFVIALAAFGMVACVNEEITELPQGGAITFESAFIDNATRADAVDPSTTTASLAGFDVWAFVNETNGVVFTDQDVTKNGGAWSYQGTQYWAPNKPYYFAALAPMNSTNVTETLATGEAAKLGLGTVAFTNIDGGEDLLYAKAKVTSKGLNQDNDPVKFQFQHLLSKVKFTFKNGFPTDNVYVVVENVEMTVPQTAEINLAQADYSKAWTAHAGTTTLAFGNVEKLGANATAEVAKERLTIPAGADKTYAISFDVTLFQGDQPVHTVENMTSTVTGYELAMGYAYNFTAEITPENLNLEAIEFEVEEVENWENGGDINALPAALVNGQPYETFEDAWTAAVTGNSELELNDNVTIDADNTLALGNGKTGTLDLNGKTLTVLSNDDTDTRAAKSGNREMFLVNGGTLNVKNGTIVYKHTGANMGWNAMTTVFNITAGGVVNIENATVKNLGGTDMNFVAHLNNWGEATLNVENSTLEAPYVAVRVFNSGYDKNNVSITNSTLKGGRCFWVHNWTVEDFGNDESKAAAQQALIDYEAVLNGNNTFVYTNAAIRLGMTNSIALDANGYDIVAPGLSKNEKTYYVSSAEGLVYLSTNGLKSGETVKLVADIDMAGVEFDGLDTFHPENNNVFDGQGHIVSNWTNEKGLSDMGFIRNWVGTVKNVTVANANLKTSGRSAIVAAKVYGNIENCHVVECTLNDSYWACGLIAGLYNAGNIIGCTVTDSSVKSNGGTGAIVGVINETAGTRKIENCSVTGTTVNNTGVYGEAYSGALFCGMINISNSTVEFNNCTYADNTKDGQYVGDLYYSADSDIKVLIDGIVLVATPQEFIKAVNNVSENGVVRLGVNIDFTTEEGGRSDNGGWWDGISYSGDKSFTIDLNGFTVGNANGALNDYLLWFKNDGEKASTITIKNGTLDAGTTAFCALCTATGSTQPLTINLEGVQLINNISNGSTIKARAANTVVNVKSGTKIIGKNSYLGIESWKATVNIYDGAEIYMNGTASYNGCLVGVGGAGVINVYGGYGKGVKGGFIAMTSGGTINVAGGEWIANTDGTVGNNSNLYVLTAQSNKEESGFAGPSIINVTGGTFRGGMDAWVLHNPSEEKAELNISGGNFNVNPTNYLVDGVTATEDNSIWTVQ